VYDGKLYGGSNPDGKLFEWNGVNAWVEKAPKVGVNGYVHSLAVYNGKLYGSTEKGTLFEWNGENAWIERAPQLGTELWSLAVYNGKLYGSTGNGKLYEWNTGREVTYDHELGSGWHHVAAVKDNVVADLKLYVDGILVASSEVFNVADYDLNNNDNLLIGFGAQDYFNGSIDELAIYNRALGENEITALYKNYIVHWNNGTIQSKNITLPENMTWDSFSANRSVPDNTFLNISIHDAYTHEQVIQNTGNSEEIFLDLSSIDPEEHNKIYLMARFQSNISHTPILHNWSVNWSVFDNNIQSPILLQSLPPVLYITEDIPEADLLDLSHYFLDSYSGITPSTYAVEYNSDSRNVTLELSSSNLSVTSLASNWTGSISVIVRCTNMHGRSTNSNQFKITVTPVNDLPAWYSIPPALTLKEDTNYTSNYSLNDYITDAEDDALDFYLSTLEDEIMVNLEAGNNITVIPSPDYFGESYITVMAREQLNHSQRAGNITIPITVTAVNDPPLAELVSPKNNSTSKLNEITLKWKGIDIDSSVNDLSFDLYFGNGTVPKIHSSDIKANNITLEGLDDGMKYYWYVLPFDGEDHGYCANGIWSFNIDSNIILPIIELGNPLDKSILNQTSVNLTWSISNYLGDNSTSHLYMGEKKDDLVERHVTNNLSYSLGNLTDNTTYYWKVEMELEGIEGTIESEIREFTVKMDFRAIHRLIMHFNVDSIEVVRGSSVTVNLTFKNVGNMKEVINLEVLGELKGHVSKDNVVKLDIGRELSINVSIFAESKLELKTYNLTINASYYDKVASASINVKITGDSSSTVKNNKSMSWILYIIAVLLFASIIAILIFLILRSKKKKEDESEVIEAEIEARPKGGITKADLDMLSIPSGQPSGTQFQGRLSYNLPEQKQAYQHKPIAPVPQVTLPKLKVTGAVKEQPKALPQSTGVPPTQPVVSTPVPMVTLPQKTEETAKTTPAVPALPMTSTVATTPITPSVTVSPPAPAPIRSVPTAPVPAAPPPEAPPMPSLASELFPKADGSNLPPPPVAAPPPPPGSTTISADARKMKLSYLSLKNASTFRIEEPMPCSICYGNISGGLQAARCSCGNISHLSCGIKIGKCPDCGVDYQGMINTVSEEAIIQSVEDSQRTAKKEVEFTVEWDEKGDMMRGLLKQLLSKEITVEQYQQISKDIKESF